MNYSLALILFSTLPADTPICITATQLAAEYAHDKTAADAKYKGRTLIVKGVVRGKRSDGSVDLNTDFFFVRTYGNVGSLKEGEHVTLRCRGDGTMLPLTISFCSVVPANTACTAEFKKAPSPTTPTFVRLSMTPQLQGQSIVVSGNTNLRDGAVVAYEISPVAAKGQAISMLFESGEIVVKGGRYSGTVKIFGWPRGKISVWVGFQTLIKGQPAWVKALYGELGDKMEGPDVKLGAAGTKRVEIEKILLKP